MSDRSAIEWTDATWNPVGGCTKVSPGCKFRYAELFAERVNELVRELRKEGAITSDPVAGRKFGAAANPLLKLAKPKT